ncbi:MAG TPA: hypothetical protein DCS93_09315 [Microscillaceae bacterium]|nr:hypothetical protein [Microscillaceae bacterium]
MEDKKNKLRISERIFYMVAIVGLLLWMLFQYFDRKNLKSDNHIIVKKSEVLDKYTQSLNKIIQEKETVLHQVSKSDKSTREQLQEQILLLQEKKEEIRRLKASRKLDFKKIVRITAELNQLQQKDEALQSKFTSYQDSVSKTQSQASSGAVTQQEFQKLKDEYRLVKQQLEEALTKNSELSGRLFATHFKVRPGEILRGKFSQSTRARRTTRLKAEYKLTRALQPGEKLIAEVFINGSKFPIQEVYRNELKSNNRVTMNLAPLGAKRFKKGNNTLNISVVRYGNKKQVGSFVFYLR